LINSFFRKSILRSVNFSGNSGEFRCNNPEKSRTLESYWGRWREAW